MGPWPMQLVVLMAVNAAVNTDITSWITDFQKSLFFIVFCFFFVIDIVPFFGAKRLFYVLSLSDIRERNEPKRDTAG